MEILPFTGAWAAGTVSSLLRYDQVPVVLAPHINFSEELGHRLSPNAAIFLPTDPGWANATRRWNTLSAPTYSALVEVSTEQDIQETVIFSNLTHVNQSSSSSNVVLGPFCE
jgi:hypothetical protein